MNRSSIKIFLIIWIIVTSISMFGCGGPQYTQPVEQPSNTSDKKKTTDGETLANEKAGEQVHPETQDETDDETDGLLDDGIVGPDTSSQVTETSQGSWKGLLMTGDNSINAFDNARKKLKSIFVGLGVEADNLKELSMKSSEQSGYVLPTNRQNIQSSLSNLNLGPNDKCIIHMTSHGSKQGFYLVGQNTLSPSEFSQILDQTCGDRPTVVLVSACYSGVFISDPVTKPNRVILTAARNDRTSFGCGTENEYTYWDNCLIDNFQNATSWSSLYQNVVSCIKTKESGGGFTSSEPQGFFGSQVSSLGIFK